MNELGKRLEAFFGAGVEIDLTNRNQVILQGDGFWIRFEREEGYAPRSGSGGGYYAHLWIQLLPESGYFIQPHPEELNRLVKRYSFRFADYLSTCLQGGGLGRGKGPEWPLAFTDTGDDRWWQFPPDIYRIQLVLNTAYRLLQD